VVLAADQRGEHEPEQRADRDLDETVDQEGGQRRPRPDPVESLHQGAADGHADQGEHDAAAEVQEHEDGADQPEGGGDGDRLEQRRLLEQQQGGDVQGDRRGQESEDEPDHLRRLTPRR
jgi:hypothetical protein